MHGLPVCDAGGAWRIEGLALVFALRAFGCGGIRPALRGAGFCGCASQGCASLTLGYSRTLPPGGVVQ